MAGIARSKSHFSSLRRRLPVQIGALLVFALLPLWLRFPRANPPPLFLPDLHVSYFVILLPLLWTVGAWIVLGLPGFAELRRDPIRRLWALGLLGLALWAHLSTSWAFMRELEPQVGQNAALQLSLSALFAVAVACAGPSARAVVTALVVSLFANSIITILQALNQGSIGLAALGEFTFAPNQPGVSVIQSGDLRWVRPMGLLPHANLLAGTLVIGLFAAASWLFAASHWRRWLGLLACGLGLWALLLTFSRGAWLGLAGGTFAVLPLLWPLMRQRAQRRWMAGAAMVAMVTGIAFYVAYQPLLAARVGEGTESLELRSISDRVVFADFAARSIVERPVLGVGIGNFPWRTSYYLVETSFDLRGDNVHHVLLAIWAELGMIGVALALLALIAGIEAALRRSPSPSTLLPHDEASLRNASVERGNANRAISHIQVARIMLLAGVFAFIIIGLIDHYPWTILHFQVAWWGSLALAGRVERASETV